MAAIVPWHSLVGFLALLGGAIVGRSMPERSGNGVWVGFLVVVIAEITVIVWAGHRISSRAMERGRGWLYGLECAAATIFVWQALLMLILELSGIKLLVSMFSLAFILISLLLYLPMGALGGWIAEKRYVG